MPSYEPPSYRRWEPPRVWVRAMMNSPTPKTVYKVRLGRGLDEFQAYYSDDFRWFRVLPDADGNGTRELGPMISMTLNLEYETALTPSTRL